MGSTLKMVSLTSILPVHSTSSSTIRVPTSDLGNDGSLPDVRGVVDQRQKDTTTQMDKSKGEVGQFVAAWVYLHWRRQQRRLVK
jgi:hypothetical protein